MSTWTENFRRLAQRQAEFEADVHNWEAYDSWEHNWRDLAQSWRQASGLSRLPTPMPDRNVTPMPVLVAQREEASPAEILSLLSGLRLQAEEVYKGKDEGGNELTAEETEKLARWRGWLEGEEKRWEKMREAEERASRPGSPRVEQLVREERMRAVVEERPDEEVEKGAGEEKPKQKGKKWEEKYMKRKDQSKKMARRPSTKKVKDEDPLTRDCLK